MPVGSNFGDLELLHEALEEDLDLDDARYLLEEFDSELNDQVSAMSEVPDDEKEILTLTKALWDVPSTSQQGAHDLCNVFQVSEEHEKTILAHRTYMATQQKRKQPNLERDSQLDDDPERPGKWLCMSADTDPCISLEHYHWNMSFQL